ncbi:MAG: hypothetical protein JW700_00865 [Candidatus Aenigmarchaeota archaeon]|nr:hypothetical protein [Candidatus Aenigmarchaeota archaeon]
MKLANITIAFFIAIFLLTLVSIEPSSTGNFITPSPIELEVGLFILAVSFFIVVILLSKKRNYDAF